MNPTQELVNMEILAFGQTTVSKFKKLKILLYGLKGVFFIFSSKCPFFHFFRSVLKSLKIFFFWVLRIWL